MADFYEFEAHMEGDRVHVRLEGEIDIITAGEVQKQLLQALDLGPGSVHFDLRGVSFMDMSGLTLMSRVAKRLNSEKRPVSCATNQRMASIFRMCDLAPLLNVTMEE